MVVLTKAQWKARAMTAEAKLADCESKLPVPAPEIAAVKGIATPGALQNWPTADIDRYIVAMKAAGATWIRVGLYYDWSPGGVALARRCRSAGLKVLGVLSDSRRIPMNPFQMAAFAAEMAPEADAFECWNEPNIINFWTSPNPEAYAGVYNAARQAIKNLFPNKTVVSGGLSPGPNATGDIDPGVFLSRALAAGMKPDAVGWHPYCNPNLPGEDDDWSTWTKMTSHPSWKQYPVWLTEFGCPTNITGDQFLVDSIREAFRLWRAYQRTTPLFIYEGKDNGTTNYPIDHFGLLRFDWSRKPAYDAFKAIA